MVCPSWRDTGPVGQNICQAYHDQKWHILMSIKSLREHEYFAHINHFLFKPNSTHLLTSLSKRIVPWGTDKSSHLAALFSHFLLARYGFKSIINT